MPIGFHKQQLLYLKSGLGKLDNMFGFPYFFGYSQFISKRGSTMKKTRGITASQEDYLEAIFHIAAEKQAARAKDIAKKLKVNMSSVTGALQALVNKGLINYAPYELITLTSEGKKIAEDVVRRHEVLRDFFLRILGADSREAGENACRVEHAVSRSILDRIIKFMEFLEVCPRAGKSFIEAFKEYCEAGLDQKACVRCSFQSLEELKEKRRKEAKEGKKLVGLNELHPGKKGRVMEIKARGERKNRIKDLGVSPGVLVGLEDADLSEDRIGVKIKGYHLSLRKDDATRILVEPME